MVKEEKYFFIERLKAKIEESKNPAHDAGITISIFNAKQILELLTQYINNKSTALDIDMECANLEDVLHGEESKQISKIRKMLTQLI